MAEPFLGQIIMGGWNFAPRGFAFCNGQIMSIAQNTALFSLLGTTYGGNGQTTFALPNLQSRVPIHFGQGPGLSNYALGQQAGEENHTLIITEMPAHIHPIQPACATVDADQASPSTHFPAAIPTNGYTNGSNAAMGAFNSGITGGSQPHNNIQPYLALNFCIAVEGIFPSRN
jgi:microcystin-dependent protein